jgi:tetratricopeptide (TPR) repeat protein
VVIAAMAFLGGCAVAMYQEADEDYYRNNPARVEASYQGAIEDQGKNALLGTEKLLSAALLRQDWREAERLAIRASTLVNIFLAGEGGERDALSLFGQEKDKPFKGEPHERAMVDFYLGALRFRERDYEGALSAFRSAMYKDRGSFLLPVEKREARRGGENVTRFLYEDDYALFKFFAAKCSQLLDEPSDAEKFLSQAKEIRPEMAPLFDQGMDPRTNVLVIIEGGRAPYKRRTGPQGAVLAYEPGPQVSLEDAWIDGRGLSHGLCEDLYLQATTVGGRQVDDLNVVKAQRQEALHAAGFATAAVGTFLAMAGSESRNRDLQTAGLIAAGVGVATMIVASAAIDPSADVRAWATLPGQLFLALGQVAPGSGHKLEIRARGPGDPSQQWRDVPVEEGVNLYLIRLLPGRNGGAWTP